MKGPQGQRSRRSSELSCGQVSLSANKAVANCISTSLPWGAFSTRCCGDHGRGGVVGERKPILLHKRNHGKEWNVIGEGRQGSHYEGRGLF